MCHRSAGDIQKYIRSDCNLDLTYDVTSVNGCIFGVSDLQPGCAAPRSAIQGPAGTFTRRFLQARCLEEWLSIQYVWSMWKKIFVTRLLGSSWLGVMREFCKGWKHGVSNVFNSVMMSKQTEVLSLFMSPKKSNFEACNHTHPVLRKFYQRPYHKTCSHLEWH